MINSAKEVGKEKKLVEEWREVEWEEEDLEKWEDIERLVNATEKISCI